MNIEQYGIYILYAFVYMAFMLSLKYALNFMSAKHYNADEELAGGNLAAGLRRTGAQLGLAIAFMGLLSGPSNTSIVQDFITTGIYGALAVCFMLSSLVFTDRLVIPGVNNTQAIKGNNIAVGIVEFGMLVGTGIIAHSSIVGEGGGMVSSLCYFLAGQITLVALVLFYEKIISRNFNIIESIGDGNIASGIYIGGKLIAYALILKSAIAGNATDATLSYMMSEYLLLAVTGMIFLYVFEYFIDLLIITSSTVKEILTEDRMVPALQLSVAKIGMALILSNAIL
ncbi:MAG: DUF350 domain-containing protein [Oleispira antarctica]|uniref:Probable 5-oxopent-3-ene-1,2,5-tricarboxylate decarboxylase n=1 Tax=Oleispira antarctica RB-8 TaxID=698738 RepID=R4YLY1_OLEAN|nr:DUF350 domain-containing protein [Oleispira antarctica]MBQ0791346.1 DUF350 domain-containing protein [Oleispira antarctica]CCK75772.1 probable 5-oxopent-3-ene-1,2,5-tricarboxylate decarboxylase [Oleispira antarctica RB-8]|tara:strand:- start:959 stop:1810 length:852 start_codon:yes stop_codon:yes gene_type:complete